MPRVVNSYRFGSTPLDLKTNLVSAWEFEETGANVAYDAVGSNNGTNNGATVQQPSVARGYDFDGISNEITNSSATGLPTTIGSISLWINPDSQPVDSAWVELHDGAASNRIVLYSNGASDAYYIFIATGGSGANIWSKGGGGVLAGDIPAGSWTHMVATWNTITDTYKIYLNTIEQTATSTGAASNPSGIDEFVIGGNVPNNRYMNGRLDQVNIWTKELSEAEIIQLYGGGSGLKYDYFDTGLKTNLVSVWELDERVEDSHGQNTGTNVGTTNNQTGKLTSSYEFDGTNDYIDIGDIGDLGTTYTVSAWAYIDSVTSQNGVIVGYRSDNRTDDNTIAIQLGHNNTDARFIVRDDADNAAIATSSITLAVDTWYHIVGIRNGNSLTIYVNAANSGTDSQTFGTLSGNRLLIGNFWNDASNVIGTAPFDGKIEQVAIWDTNLSLSDVQSLYNSGSGLAYSSWGSGLTTNLISVWELNEKVVDAHGSNDGTNSGATVNQQGIVSNLEKCYNFDGSNDNIEVPDSDDFSFGDGSDDNPFSLSVWIKFNTNKDCWVFTKRSNTSDEEWQLIHSATDNKFQIALFSEGVSSIYIGGEWDFTYTTDWTHLAVTYDASKAATGFKGYINGTEATLITISNGTYVAMNNYGAALRLGCRWDNNGINNLNGKLEQPAIWNGRVLSASEVSEIYNSGKGLNFTKWSSSLKTDLISLWKFDETSSATVCYDSHGNNDGTIVGATVNQTGKVGKCYLFNIANNRVTVPADSSFDFDASTDSYSYVMWVKSSDPSTTDSSSRIISMTSGVSRYPIDLVATSTALSFVVYDGTNVPILATTDAANDIWDGQWHMITCVYDQDATNEMKLYIDDTLDGDLKSTITGTTVTGADLKIGNNASISKDYTGELDQLFIFNKALSQAEVDYLYNSGNGRAYSEL